MAKKSDAVGLVIINRAVKGEVEWIPIEWVKEVSQTLSSREGAKGLMVKGAKMLAADSLMEEDFLGVKRKLTTLGSRGSNQVPRVYDMAALPLLNISHPLAKLYLQKAHGATHEGVVASLNRSQKKVCV
jgi:hypothetical protein